MDAQQIARLLQMGIRWVPDLTAQRHYRTKHAGASLRLRRNDGADAPLYSLLVDGVAVREFDALPTEWVIAPAPVVSDRGAPAPDPVAIAVDGLRHRDSEVRQRAAWRLAALGDHRALPALERMALTDQGQVSVERGFVDDYEPIYPAAVTALRALYDQLSLTPEEVTRRLTALLHEPAEHPNGSHHVLALGGEALRPALHAALTSPDPRVVLRAARTLAELREPGAGLAQLAHPDPVVRRGAVDVGEPAAWGASWVRWPPAEWRDAILARLAVEPEPAVRRRLVEFITQYCTKDPAAMLAVLRQCRRDPDRGVRTLVARRLHWFGWSAFGSALPELAEAALAWVQAEVEPDIHLSLLWNAPLLPYAPAATAWLVGNLEAGDRPARRAAAHRLAAAERSIAAEPLLRAADSPDHELRWAALESLAQLGETQALPKFERELATGPLLPGKQRDLTAVYQRLKHRSGRSKD